MKNFKDITISIFAIIGFVTILSSFNNQSQETHSTPESHEWEFHLETTNSSVRAYSINKKTGEVRQHSSSYSRWDIKEDKNNTFATYKVSVPK